MSTIPNSIGFIGHGIHPGSLKVLTRKIDSKRDSNMHLQEQDSDRFKGCATIFGLFVSNIACYIGSLNLKLWEVQLQTFDGFFDTEIAALETLESK